MVNRVDEKELEEFLPLIPPEVQGMVKEGKCSCLGAKEGDAAAGILLYSLEEGTDGERQRVNVFWIRWLFVAEKYRNNGIGDELMQFLSDLFDENAYDAILTVLPDDNEYEKMKDYFSSWGFGFEYVENIEMLVTKEDFRAAAEDKKKNKARDFLENGEKPKNLYTIAEISEMTFQNALMELTPRDTRYTFQIPEKRDEYEPEISCVIKHEDRVTAMVLFMKDQEDELRMVLLSCISSSYADELLTLLYYSAGWYCLKYPDSTKIRLALRNKKSKALAERVFPGKKALSVNMGYFL